MPQVTLQIGDKTYRMACAEGEEPRIQALAAHFAARTDGLAEQFPRMPADHLFLMAALLVTDELFEAREELQGTLKQIGRLGSALNEKDSSKGPTGSEMAQIVHDAGVRLNKLGDPKRPETRRESTAPEVVPEEPDEGTMSEEPNNPTATPEGVKTEKLAKG